MQATNTELHLKLLGYPEVYLSRERLKLPTQKVQAILYFLAIKKQASREELAELLWEPDARHRLRPELHRLRNLAGAEHWLELDETAIIQAKTDLNLFEHNIKNKHYQEALKQHPDHAVLLQGFSLEDAPKFMDWLEQEREQVKTLYREALRGQALELAKANQFSEALDLVDCLIDLDPLDESAYRTAMRLEYARGHIQAALQHYDHCRRTLAEELNLEPAEETQALAAEIQKGKALPNYRITTQQRLPKGLLRPPSLIGRETEWARMEAAFQAGQAIFISGPAGSGKTRLMLDFAHSKGDVVMAEGRIGDANIPLSTVSRVFHTYLDAYPDRPLEPWVKQDLSRFLSSGVSSILEVHEKPRLYQTVAAFFAHAGQHLHVFPTDNLHYFDPLSAEITNQAGFELFSQQVPERCAINTFRPESMPADFFPVLEHFIAQGTAIHIELTTFDIETIQKLLESLELTDNNNLSEKLYRLTGGNPQFIIETLKSLHATGQLANVPERITLPERLAFILRKRLDGLSPRALRIAKAVATLEQQLDTDALGELLELNAFDVAEGIAELEEAQVFHQNQFVHDLLQETTKQQTPAAVQRLLHKRRASLLEQQGLDASRIAHHYLAADEPDKALPWRLKAIEDAISKGFIKQSQQWVEALLFEVPQESHLYQHALILKGQILLQQDVPQAEDCFQEALSLSRHFYPDIEVSALEGLAHCARQRQDFKEAQALIEKALTFPLGAEQKAELFYAQGFTLSQSGMVNEAENAWSKAVQTVPDSFKYHHALANLRWHQGHFRENVDLLFDLRQRKPDEAKLSLLDQHIGMALWAMGQIKEAHKWLRQSLQIWNDSGHIFNKAMTYGSLGSSQISLGHYREAKMSLEKAAILFQEVGIQKHSAEIQVLQSHLHNAAGDHAKALDYALNAHAVLEHLPGPFFKSYALSCLANAHMPTNIELAQDYLQQALQIAEHHTHPLALLNGLKAASQISMLNQDDEKARDYITRLYDLAQKHETLEYLTQALVYKAKLGNEHNKNITLAKQALSIAETHGLASIALEAATMLTELGEHNFEQNKRNWQNYLKNYALD